MAIEQRVHDLLHQLTPQPELTIDVEHVRRGAQRRHSRRAVLVAGVTGVVAAAGVGAVRLADRADRRQPKPLLPTRTMVWRQAPRMPLTPRWDPFVIWTGSEALVAGGNDATSVGGPAPFPDRKDGAAYDPRTSTWRPIADPPVALGSRAYGPNAVVVGDTVVIAQANNWLAYDISADAWRNLPHPIGDPPQPSLAANPDLGLVYAIDRYVAEVGGTNPVQVLDLSSNTWSALPASQHQPQLDGRSLVYTPQGLVLLGEDLYPRQAGRKRETARAEQWDGHTWTRYPDSGLDGIGDWTWTGRRIISAYLPTRADSNQGSGTGVHAAALDPATGEWSPLPWLPPTSTGLLSEGWPAADGEQLVMGGYLYDDGDGSLRPVPTPDETLSRFGTVLGAGQLMLFGGYHLDQSTNRGRVMEVEPTSESWIMNIPASA